jgi:hypothetical protein
MIARQKRPSRRSGNPMKRYWSGNVTRHSNALDLQSKPRCPTVEFLYQSRRNQAMGETEENPAASQTRAPKGLRTPITMERKL